METELAVREKVELKIPTPILDTIDSTIAKLFQKNIPEITANVNRAIELGNETDENARNADSALNEGKKAESAVNEVRLDFTRPLDAGKKRLMNEVKIFLKPLTDGLSILEPMVLNRARRIKEAQEKAQREAEEAQRAADEEARKREEWNKSISLGKGGTGEVAPVEPEQIIRPTTQIGMRSTTRLKSIPDLEGIQKVVDLGVREIPGVRIFPVWKFSVENSPLIPKGKFKIEGSKLVANEEGEYQVRREIRG